MSSGNPFRTSLSYNPASSSPVPQASITTPDISVPEAREDGRTGFEDAITVPPKTKKHVRIESNNTYIPPHPDTEGVRDTFHYPLVQRLSQSEHAGSLLPISSTTLPNSDVIAGDPNTQDSWRGHEMATSDVLSGSRREYQTPQSTISPGGIPANPFARTLASIEPQEKGVGEDRTVSERTVPGHNRASLDVESFKNLLMTGKPGPRPSGKPSQSTTAPHVFGGPQFESSSSTDTSSVSRQSLFEPPHETHTESPRTSYEMAESDGDERIELMSEVSKGKKKPPPAPKHRHGKLVTQRQPQTVSFESFAATEPAPSPVIRPRDNSDVNKPLPPTPVISPQPLHISTEDTSRQRPTPLQQRSSESLPISDLSQPQKRVPPPVPLARRQSQLRTSTAENRSRSNSSLTISSQHSTEGSLPSPAPSNKDPLSNPKSPPPPPRSRHGARLTDIGTSSTNSSTTELSQRSTSVRTATPTQGPTSSRRSTLDSEAASPAPDVHRKSSVASNRNASRVVSNESTGSVMPPPPPPPRRRQSTRSSLDQAGPYIPSSSPTESRRTSIENRRTSLDSKRRTSAASESSLRHEYAPSDEKAVNEYALCSPQEESENRLGSRAGLSETGDSNNILDDMEKFQREIDELRQRFKHAG